MERLTGINKVQVSDSFGDLVNTLNDMLDVMYDSENRVGELSELNTIDKSSVVKAVNAVLAELRNSVGTLAGVEDKNLTTHLATLTSRLGDLKLYDYLSDTPLVEILDDLVVTMEEAAGGSDTISDRLDEIGERLNRKSGERIVSVEDFGVVSNSTLDQSDSVMAALNHAIAIGAGTLYFPPGRYRFRPVTVSASDLTIKGAGGRRTVLQSAVDNVEALFRVSGETKSYPLATSLDFGAVVVNPSTSDISAFSTGDDIQLEGSRNLARVKGEAEATEYTIGDETERIKDYLHSEFNRVSDKEANTAGFTIATGVRSRTVVNGTSGLGSRATSTVRRVDFRSGIWFRDLMFDGANGAGLVSMEYAKDSGVRDVYIEMSGDVSAIYLKNCKAAAAERVTIDYLTPERVGCGIEIEAGESCRVIASRIQHAGTGVCIRSIERGIIGRQHTIQNTEITNARNAAILEEATHDSTILNNRIFGFRSQGIFTTGRNIRIAGNTVKTSRTSTSRNELERERGIVIFGRGAQNGTVTDNQVEGCHVGIMETGPLKHPKNYSGFLYSQNNITDCVRGVLVHRPTLDGAEGVDGVNNNFFNVKIIGNHFQALSSAQIPLFIELYPNGLHIADNTFHGNNTAQYHTWLGGYCDYVTFTDNTAVEFTSSTPLYIDTRYDKNNSQTPMNLLMENNKGDMDISSLVGRISRDYIKTNRTLVPSNDDWFDLGRSNNRWRNIHLRNSPIVTSDRNEKSEVTAESLGLEFIKRLYPVSYKSKGHEDAETHHGFIAQDVEETLKSFGLEPKDHAGLVIDEQGRYGLRYEEFVGSLAKALIELSERIDTLEN